MMNSFIFCHQPNVWLIYWCNVQRILSLNLFLQHLTCVSVWCIHWYAIQISKQFDFLTTQYGECVDVISSYCILALTCNTYYFCLPCYSIFLQLYPWAWPFDKGHLPLVRGLGLIFTMSRLSTIGYNVSGVCMCKLQRNFCFVLLHKIYNGV